MEIKKLTGALGAEITGADGRDPAHFDKIFQAFTDHGVIALRDQSFAPEDHIAFAERFGSINVNRFFTPVPGHPQIAQVLKEAHHQSAVGEDWHTDQSYDAAPAMCSILHCVETPEVGGDTVFSSMYAAYEALSDGLKEVLSGLQAWHSSRHAFGQAASDEESVKDGRIGNPDLATQDSLHPVVIEHPLSGRPALYVNEGFTTHFDGWTAAESGPLLAFLYAHGARAEFTARVRYRPGTVVIWDNRATWHKAINDYHGHRRLMHRVTVEGPGLSPAMAA